MMTIEERFWNKVFKNGPDDCWQWTAARDQEGYGQFWAVTKQVKAHRFSYEMLNGPIREGLVIDHLCRNTGCVNPSHLEVVTDSVNLSRGVGTAALHSAATHCVNGHVFDLFNTRYRPNGWRACRECERVREHLRPKRKR